MKNDIFNLQIIPIKDIFGHEEYDESRAVPLISNLKKEGKLVNPILVASLGDGKYVQLDGMNRFSAFKMMGIHTILCQIIDYNDQESVELSSWSHFFKGVKDDFLNFLKNSPDLTLKPGRMELVGHRYIKEEGPGRLCTICGKDGEVYLVISNGNLFQKIDKLNQIVNFYHDKIERDVLPTHPNTMDINILFKEHSRAQFMIVFPTFTRHQIIDVVRQGKLLPPGITRHIIRRRCLNVNIDLSFFDNKKSVKQQNEELEKMLQVRSFRLYEEPTIYFE